MMNQSFILFWQIDINFINICIKKNMGFENSACPIPFGVVTKSTGQTSTTSYIASVSFTENTYCHPKMEIPHAVCKILSIRSPLFFLSLFFSNVIKHIETGNFRFFFSSIIVSLLKMSLAHRALSC